MPLAVASMRGWALNCLLAVKGIQRWDRSGNAAGAFMAAPGDGQALDLGDGCAASGIEMILVRPQGNENIRSAQMRLTV